MNRVAPELNAPEPGNVLIVGRDPGSEEVKRGRPFVGKAGRQLDDLLDSAGIDRRRINIANVVDVQPPGNAFNRHKDADIERGLRSLRTLIAELQPNIVIALGNEASHALVGDWPGDNIRSASGIQKRRGYFWGPDEGTMHDRKVLTTLHPSAVMRDATGVSEMLASYDLSRAYEERHAPDLARPIMDVHIVRNAAAAQSAMHVIKGADGPIACDIEITRSYPHRTLSVAFAPSETCAYTFCLDALPWAYRLLADPDVPTVWQNAQFDLHFLLTRASCRVAGRVDDTIIAWHTLWPEIAGSRVDLKGGRKSGSRRTRKSLRFFGSLYSKAAFWKDYDTDYEGMYILNGKDTCITASTWRNLHTDLIDRDLMGVYNLTRRRIWPVVEMQARGLLVDEGERTSRLARLEDRRDKALDEMRTLARPLFEERRDRLEKPDLIWARKVCPCCRNGSGKREQCWSCAGFERSPTKAMLLDKAKAHIRSNGHTPLDKVSELDRLDSLSKAELIEEVLEPCDRCDGQGCWEEYAFNPGSNDQMRMLLYDILRLNRRSSVDESTLKGLLGSLQ